jgi:hypothetical protein
MNIAGTMLNICAILSALKKYQYIILINFRHKKAITFALSCLDRSEQVLTHLGVPEFSGDSGSDMGGGHIYTKHEKL